ncbi:hypothetical protein KJZ61_01695 [Candidatus Dependentiae bacterium]|nr:hypothetical protein [Candidatus Dependentiae bacterium]
MNIRLSCLALLITASLHAMEEKIGDGQKMTALWYLVGQKRARTESNGIRHFKELDRQGIVVTIKWYDASGNLLKKITRKYCQNGSLRKFCQTFDTCSLRDDKVNGNKEDQSDIVEQLNRAFELVDHGDCEEIGMLLSQHSNLINYQSLAGETLLMRAINNIQSHHWVDLVRLMLEHGAIIDTPGNNTVFDAPSLRPDTIAVMFPDDRCSQKFAAADQILQMLIDHVMSEKYNPMH